MEVFDRFKKVEKPKIQPSAKTQYEKEVFMSSVNCINKIKHRNNEITNLYMSRIMPTSKTIIFDEADYVAFETPQGYQIDKNTINLLIQRYLRESANQEANRNKYYFGMIQQMGQELYFGHKSEAVDKIVEQIVNEDKARTDAYKEKIYNKKRKENEEKTRQELFRSQIDARKHLAEQEAERQARRNNPRITLEYKYNVDGKNYCDYNAVNINTGEILRIRNTNKVCKDINGTYLYTADIENTEHDYDAKILGTGYSVCFELYTRLEDIVNSNNIEEIEKVLELLSDSQNFQDKDNLKYIGKLNKNGQVSREKMSNSPALAYVIKDLQQRFVEKNMQENKEGWQQN